MRLLVLSVVAVALMPSVAASAEDCPTVMAEVTRLILVTAPTMHSVDATLATFERASPDAPWTAKAPPQAAVVGKSGLAWGLPFRALARPGEPLKAEGDGRSPAGFYKLGPTFGFETSSRPGYIKLETGQHVCVDDVGSPYYSTIVPRATAGSGTSGEDMWTVPVYKHGIVVDYPTNAAAKGGSCIFVHIWRGPGKGTAGCVALPEPSVAALQDWADGTTAIAILPEQARSRFAACLPQASR